MQLLGGNGYTTGFPLEKIYRDIKLNEIYEGENILPCHPLGEMIV